MAIKRLTYNSKTKKFSNWHRPLRSSMANQIRQGIKEASDPKNWIVSKSTEEFLSSIEEDKLWK